MAPTCKVLGPTSAHLWDMTPAVCIDAPICTPTSAGNGTAASARPEWVTLGDGDRGKGEPTMLDAPLQLLIGGVATALFARRGDRLWLGS